MSLLKTVAVNEAQGKVKEIYEEITGAVGMVPNILQFLSINPTVLEMQWNSVKYIASKDKDTAKLQNILRYIMSDKNKCEYCVGLLAGIINVTFGISAEELKKIEENPSTAPLSEKNKELLLFTLNAIDDPESVSAADIAKLESLGLKTLEIFDVVQDAVHMYSMNMLRRIFKIEHD